MNPIVGSNNKFEYLNLNQNPIEKIDLNGTILSNVSMFILNISMSELLHENYFSLKSSLQPKILKRFANYEYYSSVYIENRADLDCKKTAFFLKSKLFYNFLNEHIDSNNFIENCLDKSKEEFQKYKTN